MNARRTRQRGWLLVTCEHGGNVIPAPYRALFAHRRGLLASHRGYDRGALELAREMAASFEAELVYSTVSRLLVDLNRSPRHRDLHSHPMREAAPEIRRAIVRRYYAPYCARVAQFVHAGVERGRRVVHLSCHSFTPVLNGVRRRVDVGLLFDPRRSAEAELCRRWQQALRESAPSLRVRRNYPYRGTADGLISHLRKRFPADLYVGIEIEINQKFPRGSTRAWAALRGLLIDSFGQTLAGGLRM